MLPAGVPSEMQFIFENNIKILIREHLPTNAILLTTIVHPLGLENRTSIQLIGNLEELQNPRWVGCSYGQPDIRISAKQLINNVQQQMIQPVLENIQLCWAAISTDMIIKIYLE